MDANKPHHTNLSIIEQPGLAVNQYSGNTPQYPQFGEGTQKIVDGHYFEAQGNQNFGAVRTSGAATRGGRLAPPGHAQTNLLSSYSTALYYYLIRSKLCR